MNKAKTKFFTLEKVGKRLTIALSQKSVAEDFARMDFYSRLLHSLSPDENRVWRAKSRLTVEIKGFPKNIKWHRRSETTYLGSIVDEKCFDLILFSSELDATLTGICEGKVLASRAKIFTFEIGEKKTWLKYGFFSKARTIAAFCVLYDLEPHPRNDLEINIPANLGLQKWLFDATQEHPVRTYGDPSKTADVLRNEGWPRLGPSVGLAVYRQLIKGSQQQMYKLLRIEQELSSQVMRSNIPPAWRKELYESHNYTCQICHNKYEAAHLDPDHRIPVIFETDGLNKDNYKQKLMTLCRYCNQAKREATKRFGHDYDWKNSPWAYPEKMLLKKIKEDVQIYAEANSMSIEQVLKLLKD